MLTEEQLELRREGIGGSDSSVVAGINPYKQPLELYLEKRGELVPEDISDKDVVHFGNILEPVCAEEYARRTGRKVRRVNKTLRHPDFPFVLGHIDRDVMGEPRALEIKTASPFMLKEWGRPGSDEVPEAYLLQCQHYLALLPKVDVFDLAVLVGGSDFRIYEIPRDQGLIDRLLDLEYTFWVDHVQAGVPPEINFEHQTTDALLANLYPGTSGEQIELPEAAVHWHQVMEEAKARAKEYEAAADGARAHLKALAGDAAVALLPDGSGGFTRKLVKRSGYAVSPSEYIDFRFSKKPKGAKA